jgi:DNA repair photolyase
MAPSLQQSSVRGRGASENPANRFEPLHVAWDSEEEGEFADAPQTEYLIDHSRTALAKNDSPDVPFDFSLNPYRGCEHGCIYCYARPMHEYLGLSAGLDFETKIFVKPDAPALLRRALSSPKWKPQVIAMSGATDCYQPVERQLGITRRCLEVMHAFRNPCGIVTKRDLVTRDIDILGEMARQGLVHVYVSVTTLKPELSRIMEPRASGPAKRLEAIRKLAAAGVPVGVMVAPVIPALNDEEIPAILKAVGEAGARSARFIMVRLPHGVAPLFEGWLARHFPDRREKVLHRIREMRGGNLNDPRFKSRMRGEGIHAEQIRSLFEMCARRVGLESELPPVRSDLFRRPEEGQRHGRNVQLSMFNDQR